MRRTNELHTGNATGNASDAASDSSVALARRLLQEGRYPQVVELLTAALAENPAMAEGHFILGDACQLLGRLNEALASYQRALQLQPRHAFARNNMGGALQHQGRLDQAIECYRAALAGKPDFPEAFNNLGGALQLQGRLGESIAQYHAALALRPWYPDANSSLLMALATDADTTPEQYLAHARRYGELMRARAKPFTSWLVDSQSAPTDKLRVGLVSGELRANPVGHFLESVIASLDPARIELLAFATGREEDALTGRIKPFFPAWHPIAGLDDQQAAQKIHTTAPHVLIDLAGHTAGNRLPVFAWKPAPVQASWLGFFASTGVPGIDYLIADPVCAPETNDMAFSETLWRLPQTRLCFSPPDLDLDVAPLPAKKNSFITFGSFQRLTKFNDAVLAAWGDIFRALPEARLRLQMIEMLWPESREQFLRRLESFGIARERVTVLRQSARADYLAAYGEIDVVLDTFPFPGGTTTCEALWMGVPTLTLTGTSMLARQGESLLRAAGLDDWVTRSVDDYVARAIALAASIGELGELRAGLRARVGVSALCDAPRFARHLDDALHGMWARHQAKNI